MFKVHFGSCERPDVQYTAGFQTVQRNSKAFFSLGDNPYVNNGVTKWGVTTVQVDKDSTVSDFIDHYSLMFANPGWKILQASSVHLYMMADDHEWGGDNWDHTITQANSQTPINAVTQADADTHWDRGNQAQVLAVATYADNPANNDTDAVAELPSATAEVDAAKYPVRYFRVGYDINGSVDNVSPHIEFFVIDCISYRDPLADADGGTNASPSKTMLGVNQRTWLKAQLLASAATFKCIMSPKKTYKNTGADNSDTFGEYTKELGNILDFIDTNNITTVFWCAGDRHTPSIINLKKSRSEPYDHVCVVGCPTGVAINVPKNTTLSNYTRDYYDDDNDQIVGELDIYTDHVDIKQVLIHSGKTKRLQRVGLDSNASITKTRVYQ